MPEFKRLHEIEFCEATKNTGSALLVHITDDDEEFWVPLSQIDVTSEVQDEGDTGTLVVSKWLAEQRGWE